MSVYVHPIHSTDQLEQYVKFGIDLYKGNDCYVPPLVRDDMATLNPDVRCLLFFHMSKQEDQCGEAAGDGDEPGDTVFSPSSE